MPKSPGNRKRTKAAAKLAVARPSRRKLLSRGNRNIAWIEKHCCIPEGPKVGQPFKLPAYIKDDLRAIYDNPHGTRRAIISRGRKNLKTSQAALIVLLHLAGPEARPNAQLFSTALSRDQASVLMQIASKIVRLSPLLIDHIGIRESAKALFCEELGTSYRALSADASTSLGLSPALHIADELGQVRGPRSSLFEAIETATGTQDDPLTVIISTQAPTDADLLSVLIDDALAGHDRRTVLRFQTAAADLDPFTKEAIQAANPAFEAGIMNKREVLAMAEDARRMPARQSEFENLVLNRRVESASPFISREVWKSCGGEVQPFTKDMPVYAGLDLSEVGDLTCLCLISRIDGVWHVRPTFWLPADGLVEKARRDRVPYDMWRTEGYLLAAPGKSVDYEYVSEHLFAEFQRLNIRTLTFDRWNFRHLRPWLVKAGFTEAMIEERFKEMGTGTFSQSPALRELEADLLNGRVAHGGHPVLTMCAANAVTEGRDSSNRKISKSRSAGRVDGMTALALARGAVPMEEPAPRKPEYQMFFA